jgi:O-acetylserine/cysteine efflux transporter
MKTRDTAAFAIISVIWGSMWLAQQSLLTTAEQGWFFVAVYGLCAVALTVIGTILRLPLATSRERYASAFLGITFIGLPALFGLWAAAHVSSGWLAIIASATPLAVAFLCDAPWPARNAAIGGISGVIITFAGIVHFSLEQFAWGLLALASVVSISFSLIFARKNLTAIHPVFASAIQLAVAALVIGFTGVIASPHAFAAIRNVFAQWAELSGVVAGNMIAYSLYFWLLRRISPEKVAAVVWAQLLVSVAEGAILLRPHVDWRIFAGVAVTFGSLLLLVRNAGEEKLLTVWVTERPR